MHFRRDIAASPSPAHAPIATGRPTSGRHCGRLLLGAGLAALVLLAGCGRGNDEAPPPPEVGVVVASPVDVPLTRSLVGRLSAFRSADVNARVAGVLLRRVYVEGSIVRQGQPLFEIDPAPLRATLASAEAQLARDRASLAQANADLARFAQLHAQKSIAEQAYADQQFLVQQTRAAVRLAQANVDSARINLGYASVVAPIAGRAGEQQVTEGALVGQSNATLLTTISQIDPLYVNFTIGINEMNALRTAAEAGDIQLAKPDQTTVKVSLPDGTAYGPRGTVNFAAPTVNPATGTVNLRAVLPNPQFRLLPGAFVNVELALGERHGAFLLPPAAVQRDVTGTYVLIVAANDKVEHRNISTDGNSGPDWVVTAGLRKGDRVIVSGIQSVQVGEAAKAKRWQPPAPATATATADGAGYARGN